MKEVEKQILPRRRRSMERLNVVVKYLKRLPSNFYGQVVIRVRQGKAVLITEERSIKLDSDEQDGKENLRE